MAGKRIVCFESKKVKICSFFLFLTTLIYTAETGNLEVPGTCKNKSKHPEIDSSESGFLHVIEI